MFPADLKNVQCSVCPAGMFSCCGFINCTNSSDVCPLTPPFDSCPKACYPFCSAGEYCSSSLACVACSAGRVIKGGSCLTCPAGTYASDGKNNDGGQEKQTTTKATNCSLCPAGKFSSSDASIVCQSCASDRTCEPGKAACDLAAATFFFEPASRTFEKCPKGAYCAGSEYLPRPLQHYWVERSLNLSSQLFDCRPRDTCSGGVDYGSCWTISGYSATDCTGDEVQCTEGAYGALCGNRTY